ncbi:MAG: energy-coupled thiamine transporter ThiT [Bacillota bacterium]
MERRPATRAVTHIGVALALATVLSMVKVFELPQGGSVTAGSMIPIVVLAIEFGPRLGLLAGTLYGVIQFFVEPFVVHPAQLLLDYPVAFGLLGLAGLSPRLPEFGALLALAGRFGAHVLSGVIFFRELAPQGTSPLAYSLAYNSSYMVPEAIVTTVAAVFLFRLVRAGRG